MSSLTTISSHHFSLRATRPQNCFPGGSRVDATAHNFPALAGMSLSLLTLNPKSYREPHWHPNADELSYCLSGRGLMTIFSPGAGHDTFLIESGDIAFVPRGCLHHVENIGNAPLSMLICFDNELPEDLNLSSSVGVMSNTTLGATFKQDPSFFSKFKKSAHEVFIGQVEKSSKAEVSYQTNRFKMNIEALNPQVNTAGGWAKMCNASLLPTLEGLAVFSLLLKKEGVREPHWHPNASELNYLISGSVRITLLSPGGSVDTFDMTPGDLSFLPRGYFHHIENTGSEDAHLAVFFNNQSPSDIGLSGCLGAYSNEILASLFGITPAYLDKLPKYQQDLFVVSGGG